MFATENVQLLNVEKLLQNFENGRGLLWLFLHIRLIRNRTKNVGITIELLHLNDYTGWAISA